MTGAPLYAWTRAAGELVQQYDTDEQQGVAHPYLRADDLRGGACGLLREGDHLVLPEPLHHHRVPRGALPRLGQEPAPPPRAAGQTKTMTRAGGLHAVPRAARVVTCRGRGDEVAREPSSSPPHPSQLGCGCVANKALLGCTGQWRKVPHTHWPTWTGTRMIGVRLVPMACVVSRQPWDTPYVRRVASGRRSCLNDTQHRRPGQNILRTRVGTGWQQPPQQPQPPQPPQQPQPQPQPQPQRCHALAAAAAAAAAAVLARQQQQQVKDAPCRSVSH
jgi:hypothetical protein